MPKEQYFFVDLGCEENFNAGLPYFAAGIVIEDARNNGESYSSGKDLVVSYIDPWGTPQRCWRSAEEVRLIPTNNEDYELLRCAIESAYNAGGEDAA